MDLHRETGPTAGSAAWSGPGGFVPAVLGLLLLAACGPKTGEQTGAIDVQDGKIVVVIEGSRDSVFEAASHVFVQEGIDLRIYLPKSGLMETNFIDLAGYSIFDPEIWDATERLVKLRFRAANAGEKTTFVCEPLYNPYEVFTGETEYGRLRLVPPGHPGFEIAALLTRRIAALTEGKAVSLP